MFQKRNAFVFQYALNLWDRKKKSAPPGPVLNRPEQAGSKRLSKQDESKRSGPG